MASLPRFLDILQVLTRHRVEFIVVGGVAAILEGERHIVPDDDKLATMRLHQLITIAGPLDVLATIGKDMTYEHLAVRTHERVLGDLRVRCLNLDTIIESKEQANRDKDRAALPVLRRTLELKGKSGDGG